MFSAFSLWAVIPPRQPPSFLFSGSRGAASGKARRPCISATRSPGPLPTPAPHFLAQSCSAFPGCTGGAGPHWEGPHVFPKGAAADGAVTTAYHGRGALTRRTGASRGSLSAAGWASCTAAASCRPGRAWSGAALLWPR